jgi:type 1 glutamine amidotransferase
MKKTKYIIISFVLAVSIVFLPGCQTEQSVDAEYSALVVTGQNNHKWKTSSPVLKEILENSGLFAVDIATSPAQGGDMSGFAPEFSNYDVVVLDYTGDSWSETTKTAFVDYVSQGGGVVVYHAADNAFKDWKEYNLITGIGGWSDRSEKDGPYIRWKDGEIVRDMSPGRGGSHGAQHAFRVVNRVTDHPITKGLPTEWMHGKDELYSQLRGPAENLTVLSTAYADTAKGGTGENEPVLMTINYGSGRIFHTVIGHAGSKNDNPAMECVGFIVTLQRGAEWAATGAVTQVVPIDFPRSNVLSSWDNYRPDTVVELLECLNGYKKGDSRKCLQDLRNIMRQKASSQDEIAKIEEDIIKFLESGASKDAKNELCRDLSQWGSTACLPVLKKLMEDNNTKEMARFASERISGEYTN